MAKDDSTTKATPAKQTPAAKNPDVAAPKDAAAPAAASQADATPAVTPAPAVVEEKEAAPARVSTCVVNRGRGMHVGDAVNGKVCSYHAMHYDAAGNKR